MRKIFLFIMLIFIGTSSVGFSEVTSKEKKVLMEKLKKEIKRSEEKEDTDIKSIKNLIALIKEYIKGNPSEAYAYEYLGMLLMIQEKYDEAEKSFMRQSIMESILYWKESLVIILGKNQKIYLLKKWNLKNLRMIKNIKK